MAELPKAYDAKIVDNKWTEFWLEKGFSKADPASPKEPFCVVMPPPNVTGQLHMGHAMNMTLQDVLTRWKRMSGFNACWIPGTDHAGISTQTVVERHLIKTVGKKRVDFSREEFLEHVWKWKEENEATILNQLKRLGCSCDWSSLRFTMDDGNNAAVRTAFEKLYRDGLIYRGDYLVNWDPVTMTAIADDEVEYEERNSFLWHIKYPLADQEGFITVATTRPETMLGDTAIAVSSSDKRYAHLIGQFVQLPLTERRIPIIADPHVDPAFGTGAVKVTPAHDPNDYQIGLNHKLPFINIMTPDGKINENGNRFAGLSMEEGRKAVVKALEELNLLAKSEPYLNRVGVSYRSKAVIEPYLSKQWFVKMDGFARSLKEMVEGGSVKLIPEHWVNTYNHWINTLRDWCISRQLWWGHRIPIWYNKANPDQMICYAGEGLPEEVQKAPSEWEQDSDVLDTWFSSALWPFSTLGWPKNSEKLEKFYPNSTLITGHDILFFWVARMLLMGKYLMGKPPFPKTFLHGLIFGKSYWKSSESGQIHYITGQERIEYDLGKATPSDVSFKWEKMSKSKGNVIDPIEMIEEYGADAVRMALCSSVTYAREIDLERRRFEEFRNFANKIWNGARFVLMNLDSSESPLTSEEFSEGLDMNLLSLEDRWILSLATRTIKEVNSKLESYTFDQAAIEAYDFFWKEFCAYYLEISKPILFGKSGTNEMRKNKQKLLLVLLCQAIRLIHPMAPFITEELFQILKERFSALSLKESADPFTKETISALSMPSCMVAPYPQVIDSRAINDKIEETFKVLEEMIYAIRNIRGEMKLPPNIATPIHIIGNEEEHAFQIISSHPHIISALVKTDGIHLHVTEPSLDFASTAMVDGLRVMIPLPAELQKKEEERLLKEKDRVNLAIEKTKTQLSNPEFIEKAPSALVDKLKLQLANSIEEFQEIENKLKLLKK